MKIINFKYPNNLIYWIETQIKKSNPFKIADHENHHRSLCMTIIKMSNDFQISKNHIFAYYWKLNYIMPNINSDAKSVLTCSTSINFMKSRYTSTCPSAWNLNQREYLQALTNCPGVRRQGYAANFVAMTMLSPIFRPTIQMNKQWVHAREQNLRVHIEVSQNIKE